jgi:hypothetical protein
MKLSVCFALAALTAGGIQAAAQDRGVVKADESITATGCLQRAQRTGSAGGTVVGTSAPPDRADDEANSSEMVDKFLLASAVPVPAAGTPRADASSPTGTSGTVQPTSFGLEGHEADLEQHNGARVEVSGVIIPPASSGQGTGGAATASGVKRIRVASFKVLAAKCTTP